MRFPTLLSIGRMSAMASLFLLLLGALLLGACHKKIHPGPGKVPTITIQPVGTMAMEGQTATFRVEASGVPSPSFQWERQEAGGDAWTAIKEATQGTYVTQALKAEDDGASFRVQVSNSAGHVTSDAVKLVVQYLIFSKDPDPVTANADKDTTVTFKATAKGNPGPTNYQWYYGVKGMDVWEEVDAGMGEGFTTDTCTIRVDPKLNGKVFCCKARNGVCPEVTTSNPAELTVHFIRIDTQPASHGVVDPGKPQSFSVQASGNPGPLRYAWRIKPVGKDWEPAANKPNLSGADQPTLNITGSIELNGALFHCVVGNKDNTNPDKTSGDALLNVNHFTFTSDPKPQSATEGAPVTFSAIAASYPPSLTYWWQARAKEEAPWADLDTQKYAGTAGEELKRTVTATRSLDGYEFRCMARNDTTGEVITTKGALLTVNHISLDGNFPANTDAIAGTEAVFEVKVSGRPLDFHYTWQYKPVTPGATWSDVTTDMGKELDSPRCRITATKTLNKALIRCLVSNSVLKDVPSREATLTVKWLDITQQPQAKSISVGQSASFTVVAEGSAAAMTYRWSCQTPTGGWEAPPQGTTGANAQTLTFDRPGVQSTLVRCEVSDGEITVPSDAALLAVTQLTISGNAGVAGATVNFAGLNTTADAQGKYSLNVDHGASGDVTPTKENYRFNPSKTAIEPMTSPRVVDFTAIPTATLDIEVTGLPVGTEPKIRILGPGDIDVTLTGWKRTFTTPGRYTIIPSAVQKSTATTFTIYQSTPTATVDLQAPGHETVIVNYRSQDATTVRITEPENPEYYVPIFFVPVPRGSFTMGSTAPEDSSPEISASGTHTVTISSDFSMSTTEVDETTWIAVMGPHDGMTRGSMLPARNLTLDEVQRFVATLNERFSNQYHFRLPTEAEWEYAARGGSTSRFSFGDDPRASQAYAYFGQPTGTLPHSAWTLLPNSLGLYDMHGNVSEYCEDGVHATYEGAPTDGSAWKCPPLPSGDPFPLVITRGGNAWGGMDTCSSAYRWGCFRTSQQSDTGIRLVMTPVPQALSWEKVDAQGPGQPGLGVYDEASGQLLMFGRFGVPSDEAWTFDGARWRQAGSPLATRLLHAGGAFDAGRGRTVLAGGLVEAPSSGEGYNRVTFEGACAEDGLPACPERLFDPYATWEGAPIAYDSTRGAMLRFGGRRGQETLGGTWRLGATDTAWAFLDTGFPGRYAHGLTYDAARDRFVIFGGQDARGAAQGNTLEYDPAKGTWKEAAAGSPEGPSPRLWPAMAYDPRARVSILAGGQRLSDGQWLRDVWQWDGSAWTRLPDAPGTAGPSVLYFDSRRGKLMLFAAPETYSLKR